MKTVWLSLLMQVVEYLTSGEFVEMVKKLVLSLFEDDKKTGDEKRLIVLEELKKSGMTFGSNLASLAIEATVAYIKLKGVTAFK